MGGQDRYKISPSAQKVLLSSVAKAYLKGGLHQGVGGPASQRRPLQGQEIRAESQRAGGTGWVWGMAGGGGSEEPGASREQVEPGDRGPGWKCAQRLESTVGAKEGGSVPGVLRILTFLLRAA